jgi:hypothetical protein
MNSQSAGNFGRGFFGLFLVDGLLRHDSVRPMILSKFRSIEKGFRQNHGGTESCWGDRKRTGLDAILRAVY